MLSDAEKARSESIIARIKKERQGGLEENYVGRRNCHGYREKQTSSETDRYRKKDKDGVPLVRCQSYGKNVFYIAGHPVRLCDSCKAEWDKNWENALNNWGKNKPTRKRKQKITKKSRVR